LNANSSAPASKPDAVAEYWNGRIHDLEMTEHEVGTREFFRDLDEYRFDKLRYLPEVVDFAGYAGKRVLEVGCGIGIDLVRFARGGAVVTGIDLSKTAIDLASRYFEIEGLDADLRVMDGAALEFPDDSFDLVYVHGVLPYASDPEAIARECHRVVKPGGQAIFMNYNKWSWLMLLSKVAKVGLEHDDAPVFRPVSGRTLRGYLAPFDEVRIEGERFPVKSRLHKGLMGILYNSMFVPAFKILPKAIVRPLGWHWMAYCTKR